jgi:3-oxoacyl-[acyl-carrier-protein] synthase II
MRAVVVTGTGSVAGNDQTATLRSTTVGSRLGRLDRYSRLALCAADAAVHDAGLDPSRWAAERVGVVLGTTLGCYEANAHHRAALDAGEPSPRLFSATLASAPVGEIAIHLAARGPQLALAQGVDAPLVALAEARRLIVTGRADVVLAGACDAIPAELRDAYPGAPADGAWFFVLAHPQAGGERRGAIHGGGSGFGAHAREEAARAACREAGFDLFPSEHPGGVGGALGGGRPALVVAADTLGSASALIVS